MNKKDKKNNWKHGRFAKIFVQYILEVYQSIEDSQFTKGIILDERPLSQILIEETSKDVIAHYTLTAKKILLNQRKKKKRNKISRRKKCKINIFISIKI